MRRAGAVVLCACVCGAAQGAQFSYTAGYQMQLSDNITLAGSEDDRHSDVINTLFTDLVYTHATRSVQERLHVGFEHWNYYRDYYDDENIVTFDGFGEWHLVPRLFSWTATDTYRQVRIEPRLPDTPDNRENSNVLFTGPNLYLRFGPLDRLTLEARYGDVHIADRPLDNRRAVGAARWEHRVSTHTHFGAEYEYTDAEFEDEETANASDYRRQDAFATFGFGSVLTTLDVQAGGTRIEREGSETLEEERVSVDWQYQVGRRSRLGVGYGREFSDTGTALLSNVDGLLIESDTALTPGEALTDIVTGDLYFVRRKHAIFRHVSSVVPWALRFVERDLDFVGPTEDRLERIAALDGTYLFSTRLSFGGSLSRLEAFYRGAPPRDDVDTEVSVYGLYRMTRQVNARLELRRVERESTDRGVEYTENRILLTLTYGAGASPARPGTEGAVE